MPGHVDQRGLMDWTAGFAPHFEAIGAKKLRYVLERFAFGRLRVRVAHGIHRGGRSDLARSLWLLALPCRPSLCSEARTDSM